MEEETVEDIGGAAHCREKAEKEFDDEAIAGARRAREAVGRTRRCRRGDFKDCLMQ
jgi:hypothetical protein